MNAARSVGFNSPHTSAEAPHISCPNDSSKAQLAGVKAFTQSGVWTAGEFPTEIKSAVSRRHDAKLTDLLQTLADCPKARSVGIHDLCKARYAGL